MWQGSIVRIDHAVYFLPVVRFRKFGEKIEIALMAILKVILLS